VSETTDETAEMDEMGHTQDRSAKRGFVVAIDGPAGAGKSTLARGLAEEFDLPYLNTGLMYRELARRALEAGVDPDDESSLAALAERIAYSTADGPGEHLLIDGAEPSPDLRTARVEAVVSRVARHPGVRAVLRRDQRALGVGGCVMEGRDIGTVVFPDADVKIFLEAPVEVRAARRELEREPGPETGAAATPGRLAVQEVQNEVERRDALDGRTNPLVPAPDAHLLDTTALDRDQVLEAASALVATAMAPTGER
jgi:cytidylate kinase